MQAIALYLICFHIHKRQQHIPDYYELQCLVFERFLLLTVLLIMVVLNLTMYSVLV
jgi:hypothetical protein